MRNLTVLQFGFTMLLKILKISQINTRHINLYLFECILVVILNIVTKFQDFDIFGNFVTFLTCRLLVPCSFDEKKLK